MKKIYIVCKDAYDGELSFVAQYPIYTKFYTGFYASKEKAEQIVQQKREEELKKDSRLPKADWYVEQQELVE